METIPAKRIVTRTKTSEWFGADYNMNIYRGCSHGCIYCDSRSNCYRVDDFDRIKAKEDALRIIRDDLRRIRRRGVVATGAMSDPYNPFEESMQLTRNALALIDAFHFGVAIDTKSPLVVRDTDILGDIGRYRPAIVKMTITTDDDTLCRKIEPNVAPSSERFGALRQLADEGIFCGILMMPILPDISDTGGNIQGIVRMAAMSGARFVYPALGLSMRDGQREYLYAQLDAHFPGLREKYEKRYGKRYQCPSPKAKKLWDIFRTECIRHGLLYQMGDIVRASRLPCEGNQLTLF